MRVLKAFMNDLEEFSALRFAIPTQHLNELANRPLDLTDFKMIINDFINNSIDNAISANYNFGLIRNGLADYFTDDDQAFIDIKLQTRTIKDEALNVEMLKGVVDSLGMEMANNFVAAHHNLQVVKAIIV